MKVIRCDMCSSEKSCPYDNVPQYPCKDMMGDKKMNKRYEILPYRELKGGYPAAVLEADNIAEIMEHVIVALYSEKCSHVTVYDRQYKTKE